MPKNNDNASAKQNLAQKKVQGELYAGPVPHPDILQKLNSILPGAAERIFQMAEKDQQQTIAMQRGTLELNFRNIENAHKERTLSQWLAFVVCILFLACGTWLVLEGHDWVGGIVLGSTFASVIGSFLFANAKKKK